MNRRRFLAALASIPLVGRLVPKAAGMSPAFIQACKDAPTVSESPILDMPLTRMGRVDRILELVDAGIWTPKRAAQALRESPFGKDTKWSA